MPKLETTETGPITQAERERFDWEMRGNFDGSKTTVDVLFHIISSVPAAAAAFRAWLADTEGFTRQSENAELDPDSAMFAEWDAASAEGP